MLSDEMLPMGYSEFDTSTDVIEELFRSDVDDRQVRMFIVWDNPVGNLPLESVLDHMRETGAAMVTKVEQVIK